MSDGNSSSFSSNNEFDWPFNTSYGSSQSTQATEVSEYGNTSVAGRQSRNTAADEGLFQNVGYGTNQVGLPPINSSAAFGNNYGYPSTNPTTPGHIQQTQVRSVYEQPWSGLPLLHQFDPNPTIHRPSASRSGQLDCPVDIAYDMQSPAVPFMPSGSNRWARHPSTGMTPSGISQNSAVSWQYTSPPSIQGRIPIPRLPSSPQSSGTTSDVAEAKPRYPCQVPGCITSCTRRDDLARHVRCRHDEAEIGPYWLCHLCGRWEYNGRQDKMREHYRIDHNHDLAKDERPYRSVQSVGDQNHIAKISTNGKLTRRRKKRVIDKA